MSDPNPVTDDFERRGAQIAASRPDLLMKVSDAQRRVLDLLLAGLTEPQIALKLARSRHTVHDHTKAIYASVGVSSRVQLVLLFSRPPEPLRGAAFEPKPDYTGLGSGLGSGLAP